MYLIGYAVIIAGLGLGAYYMHIPGRWIVVGVLVLIGMGLVGVSKKSQGRP